MNITLPDNAAQKKLCTFDDCLISSFLNHLLAKKKETKQVYDYNISKHVKNVKAELLSLNSNEIAEMSYEYLSAMERALPDVKFRYVVIYKNDVPALFAYYQLYKITSKNFNLKPDNSFTNGLLRLFLDVKKLKVLVSGNAMRTDTIDCIYDESILTYDEAIDGLTGGAERIAAEVCPSAVILRNVSPSRKLERQGYIHPFQDNTMVLQVDKEWHSLADYTNALTRKYKARAGKIIAAGSTLSLVNLDEHMVTQHEPELNKLFRELTKHQSFVAADIGDHYFSSLKKVYKENFEVWGIFRDDKLIAFYTAFVTGDTYEIYYIGLSYSFNDEFQLYFNILFSGLDRAIALKKDFLKLGRTSFDAKASMGAQPQELSYVVKLPMMPDFMVEKFVAFFSSTEDNQWKQRNPLKKTEPSKL